MDNGIEHLSMCSFALCISSSYGLSQSKILSFDEVQLSSFSFYELYFGANSKNST